MDLHKDRFAQAALAARVEGRGLLQPQLSELAQHLYDMDQQRQTTKGKPMSDDHLKQEAAKWARQKTEGAT